MAVYTETVKMKDEVSESAKKAAHEADLLEKAIKGTQDALLKAQALGNVDTYKKLKLQAAAYKAALDVLPASEIAEVRALKANALAQEAARKERELGEKSAAKAAVLAAKQVAVSSRLIDKEEKKKIAGATLAAKQHAAAVKLFDKEEKKRVASAEEAQEKIQAALHKEGQAFSDMVGKMGQVAVAGAAIVGGVVLALGAAVVAGAKFAIEARTSKLAVEDFYAAMSQGLNTGSEVDAMVEGLSAKIGIAKDTLEPLTKELMSMGIVALPQLEDMLLATASASALMGKKGEAAFLALTQKIQTAVQAGQALKIPIKGLGSLAEVGLQVSDVSELMGLSAKELSTQLKNGTVDAGKFGDALQDAVINKGASALDRMAASIENLKSGFLTNLGDMFEDIDVGPFLAEVRALFDIFSQAKPSGQALKAGIGGFFGQVFKTATSLVPLIKHFFLDLIIFGLKAYIALKPVLKWFDDMRNNESAMTMMRDAWNSIKAAIVVVGAVLVGVGIVIATTIAWIGLLAVAADRVREAVVGAFANIGSSALTMASEFIEGLVGGIVAGYTRVKEAVTTIANSVKDTFKQALGIASPSKVMFAMGENVAQGAALGIEGGAPDVHGASTTLAASATKGMGETTNNSNASRTINVFAEFTFGGSGGGSASELTEQAVSLIFERVALESGL